MARRDFVARPGLEIITRSRRKDPIGHSKSYALPEDSPHLHTVEARAHTTSKHSTGGD